MATFIDKRGLIGLLGVLLVYLIGCGELGCMWDLRPNSNLASSAS